MNVRSFPKRLDSKTSCLRITVPENLDLALEGLIRKVLREQPRTDDIYSFAAGYFEALVSIRDKSGRKPPADPQCPFHDDEDAHEMFKLATSFPRPPAEPPRKKHDSGTAKKVDAKPVLQLKKEEGGRKKSRVEPESKPESRPTPDLIKKLPQVPPKPQEEEQQQGEFLQGDPIKELVESELKGGNPGTGQELCSVVDESGAPGGENKDEIAAAAKQEVEQGKTGTEKVAPEADKSGKEEAEGGETGLPLARQQDSSRQEPAEALGDKETEIEEKEEVKPSEEKLPAQEESDPSEKETETPAGEEPEKERPPEGGVQVEETAEGGQVKEETKEDGPVGVTAETVKPEETLTKPPEEQELPGKEKVEKERNDEGETEKKDEMIKETTEDVETETKDDVGPEKKANVETEGEGDGVSEKKEKGEAERKDDTEAGKEENLEAVRKDDLKPEGTEDVEIVQDDMEIGKEDVETEGKGDLGTEKKDDMEAAKEEGPGTGKKENQGTETKENVEVEPPSAPEVKSEGEIAARQTPAVETLVSEVFPSPEKEADEVQEEKRQAEGKNEGEEPEGSAALEEGPAEDGSAAEAPTGDELCTVVDSLQLLRVTEAEKQQAQEPLEEKQIKTIETHYYDLLQVPETVTKEYKLHQTPEAAAASQGPGAPGSLVKSFHLVEAGAVAAEALLPAGAAEPPEADLQSEELRDLVTPSSSYSLNLSEMSLRTVSEMFLESEKQFSSLEREEVRHATPRENEKPREGDARKEVEEVVVKAKQPLAVGAVPVRPRETEEALPDANAPVQEEKPEKKPEASTSEESNDQADGSRSNNSRSIDSDTPIISVEVKTVIETQVLDEEEEVDRRKAPPDVEVTVRATVDFPQEPTEREETAEENQRKPEEVKSATHSHADESGGAPPRDRAVARETSSADSDATASSAATEIKRADSGRKNFSESRSLLSTRSLDFDRRSTLVKTRSLSAIRHGVTDFDVWNTIEKELEAAATKIQSKFRGYSTRKKLRREDAVQITTEESSSATPTEQDAREEAPQSQQSTGEFHDGIVLSEHPR